MITAAKTTDDILKEMLTENTGSHMLDSGGAYGRNWSRNKGRDFDKEPATVLSFEFGGIEITHNIYHWLRERLEYDAYTDNLLHQHAERKDNKDKDWSEILEEFLKDLCAEKEINYSPDMVMGCNTANGEDLLSQVMQYWYIEELDDPMVILRIHGGCDIRGGYTAPRIFYCTEEYSIMDNARAQLWCKDNHEHNWYTDDAYTFYAGEYGPGATRLDLKEYKYRTMEELRENGEKFKRKAFTNGDLFEGGETKRVQYSHAGTLVADEKRNVGYCPVCGGVLEACA